LRLGAAEWFIARARELGVEKGPPDPLLLGRHLLELGVQPGPQMGELLRRIYELQLDGKVTDLAQARERAIQIIGLQ
jgi:tRNA nucleotidyltransferase (CCA-adding enzyme)